MQKKTGGKVGIIRHNRRWNNKYTRSNSMGSVYLSSEKILVTGN